MKWVSREEETQPQESEAFSHHNFRPIVAQVLQSRAWSKDAEDFLNPRLDQITDPSQMLGMEAAVERIGEAIIHGECIAVYGDYDIDGMSGLSLFSSFFKACGSKNVLHFQPQRLTEGYGVHPSALESLKEQGAQVVITVDTGITACSAAIKAKELGIDLVITDHHQALEQMPDTPWIVNPNQRGDTSGLGYLSGTGVAFYFCMALRRYLREKEYFTTGGQLKQPDLRYWLDLFALGTVADHVPLIGDNRNLVRVGLGLLRRSHRPGLRALIDEILADPEQNISARDIAFSIAPKLNAASRLGHADLSTKLLMCTDHTEADDIVIKLFELNAQRSEIQKKVFTEAHAQAEQLLSSGDHHILVLAGEWHEGVLGIVASKIVESFGRPAIILGKLEDGLSYRGSMRSITGWSSVRLLQSCDNTLIKFGGHDMAAGLHVQADRLEEFSKAINHKAQLQIDSEDSDTGAPELKFDGDLPSDIRPDDLVQLDTLGPWGEGNPEPLFLIKKLSLSDAKHLKDLHFKGKFAQKYDVIGFFKSNEIKKLQNIGVQNIDALVRPEINRFRNAVSVQLRLEHIRASKT
jgi:single-stranded-DNA-specific exonuclease